MAAPALATLLPGSYLVDMRSTEECVVARYPPRIAARLGDRETLGQDVCQHRDGIGSSATLVIELA